jgi:hypothetical protein
MTMLDSTATALRVPHGDFALDQAHLAVVAFLARYRRSLDAAGQGGLDAQVLDLVVSSHGPWRGRPRRMRIGVCRPG